MWGAWLAIPAGFPPITDIERAWVPGRRKCLVPDISVLRLKLRRCGLREPRKPCKTISRYGLSQNAGRRQDPWEWKVALSCRCASAQQELQSPLAIGELGLAQLPSIEPASFG